MRDYDASKIDRIELLPLPTRWDLLLAQPVTSWSVEDWTYAVIRTDDCPMSRVQAMTVLRRAYPELGDQFSYVLQVWEAGYGPAPRD